MEGPLVEILKLSARSVDDTICRDVLNSMVTQVSRAVDKERLVGLLAAMKEPRQVFHHMAASFVGLRISLKAFDFLAALSDRLQEQYVAHVLLLCDVEDMALDTEGQSQNPRHVVDYLPFKHVTAKSNLYCNGFFNPIWKLIPCSVSDCTLLLFNI